MNRIRITRGRRENTNVYVLGKPEGGLRILNVERLVFDVWSVAVERCSVPSLSVRSGEYICHNNDKEIEHSGLPVRTSISRHVTLCRWVNG